MSGEFARTNQTMFSPASPSVFTVVVPSTDAPGGREKLPVRRAVDRRARLGPVVDGATRRTGVERSRVDPAVHDDAVDCLGGARVGHGGGEREDVPLADRIGRQDVEPQPVDLLLRARCHGVGVGLVGADGEGVVDGPRPHELGVSRRVDDRGAARGNVAEEAEVDVTLFRRRAVTRGLRGEVRPRRCTRRTAHPPRRLRTRCDG